MDFCSVHRKVNISRTFQYINFWFCFRTNVYIGRHKFFRLQLKHQQRLVAINKCLAATTACFIARTERGTFHPIGIRYHCTIFDHRYFAFLIKHHIIRTQAIAQMMIIAVATSYHHRSSVHYLLLTV